MVFRRELLKSTAGISMISVLGNSSPLGYSAFAQDKASKKNKEEKFDFSTLKKLAADLAMVAYKEPNDQLPPAVDKLDFDGFRSIVFKPERALWSEDQLNFQVQFFPRGFLYRPRLDIYQVVDGLASPVPYDPDMFTYTDPKLKVDQNLGFSGIKLMTPLNGKTMEEFAVFLGASYFRAVAKGQQYGLSARGFAKGTADPQGEEFPLFRAFWIVKPDKDVESLVIYALLDSPSIAGAYQFTIRPGTTTIFDVENYLYPRKLIVTGGVAPLTGMFYFDSNNRDHIDDWRPAAHDSEGLLMWTGKGEELWRPLNNPVDLQYSVFSDATPRGFGLIQRKRDFSQYEDLALHYELRPSLWIEPIGDWESGSVNLVEIPTPSEVNDNIVAFWRPQQPFKENQEYNFIYRMYWGWDNPWISSLARVAATRIGSVVDKKNVRFFCIDFFDGPLNSFPPNKELKFNITTTAGKIDNIVVEANTVTHGWRVTFEFSPQDAKSAELRASLMDGDAVISEKWLYRWTP